MNESLLLQLQAAEEELTPQFKALRGAMSALKKAIKLAGEETLDPLAMQKALVKLEEAAKAVDNDQLQAATEAFAAQTQEGLDALAFEFARDLKHVFEERGQTVEGRPPTLAVGLFTLQIDAGARKAQWFYGHEALTKPMPLSIHAITKAYDRAQKSIGEREIKPDEFLGELYKAWQDALAERKRPPSGKRINVVEIHAKVTLNRQNKRFWNSPARSTFKDYPRELFVRDLVLIQETPTVNIDGETYRLRLAGATKNQTENAMRSIWLPQTALDGDYYADVTFEEA